MTEVDWRACADLGPMLRFVRDWGSDRKMRLFGAACYRSVWAKVAVSELEWEVLRASEAYADGAVTKQVFKFTRKRVGFLAGPCVAGEAWEVAGGSSRRCLGQRAVVPGGPIEFDRLEELSLQLAFLHDIFGNPFRPVEFDAEWRTPTVTQLAQHIYEARAFTTMPILADALQDAGCDNADVLNHCRDATATHVRGCWVVDLVLEKS